MDLKFKDNTKLKIASITQLEYIESTGTQYVQTNYNITSSTEFECKCKFANNTDNSVVFGGTFESGKMFYIQNSSSSNKVFAYNNSSSVIFTGTDEHIIKYKSGKLYVDNVEKLQFTYNNISQNVRILDIYVPSIYDNFKFNGKFYYLKFYDNGVLSHEFIPIKDTNNVVCIYDTITKTFLYNAGTGNFVAGPVVNTGLPGILLKTTTLYHKNTPNVDGLQLLNSILSTQETAEDVVLTRIRVDIGNVSGSLVELIQYAGMAGFNDNYEPQTKPRLVGTWTINDWYTTAQLAQAQATFDGLTIVGDANISYDIIDEHTIHILSTNVPSVAPVFITSDITKIYIGAGSSSSDDNTLMSAFSSDSKWSSHSSLLDTWYNYLHPTT